MGSAFAVVIGTVTDVRHVIADRHDLTVVATGRASLTQVFPRMADGRGTGILFEARPRSWTSTVNDPEPAWEARGTPERAQRFIHRYRTTAVAG